MSIAQVIKFPSVEATKPTAKEVGKPMYSNKFEQGYVMSSRLYRKEVWPFLSDAARNVYAELENRINGHNKESDFVSYSQLQGGELSGSRKLSRGTVADGIEELIKKQVISITETGRRGVKKYKINELSLAQQSDIPTSSDTALVQLPNRTSSISEPVTSSTTELTIDNSLDSLELKKEKHLPVDNFESNNVFDSIEYHPENPNLYSLRELANEYLIKTDFSVQAKEIHPDLTDEQILIEIKNFAQWSTAQQKRTAQAWMNNWIYRIQKFMSPKTKSPTKPKTAPKSKNMSDGQITMFSQKLCKNDDFASMYSNVGESQKQFEARISIKLRDPESIQAWASYLRDVGYAGNLGGVV